MDSPRKSLKDIQLLFHAGYYNQCVITQEFGGYHLAFAQSVNGKPKNITHLASQRNTNHPRIFKTIDAATQTAKQIGFRKIDLHLSEHA